MVIFLLPFFMIVQPANGMALTAPMEDDNKTRPMSPLSASYSSCILGNLATQFANTKPFTKKAILNARKNRRNFEVEHRVVWQDGSLHWVLCRGQTMYEDSNAVKMVGTCMNIDERKAADDLRLYNAKIDE